MDTRVADAKRRAIEAQNARLQKRLAELTATPPAVDACTTRVHHQGHRTYYTIEGPLSAATATAKAALADYSWEGPNPYSPWTDDPVPIAGGKVRIVASHCSSSE